MKKAKRKLRLRKKNLVLTIGIGFVALAIILTSVFVTLGRNNLKNLEGNNVCFENTCFTVELAITPEEKAQGLMFIEELDENSGMLFIFDEEDYYPFWMKNTLIPLDLIWIDENYRVVHIYENAQPCDDTCKIIQPNEKAKYVLEINAGISDRINLNEGDVLEFIINLE